jgi:AmmeMemoRadiSam system protein B
MMIREPARAGQFYPAEPGACRRDVERYWPPVDALPALPGVLHGGIVPHAGWMCSGAVAAKTLAAIVRSRTPQTVVIFGAAHRPFRTPAALFARGAWETPLGTLRIDERLAERVLGAAAAIADDPHAHDSEHAIEVQLPLVQHAFADAMILPISMMPTEHAAAIGHAVAQVAADSDRDVVYLGSTDLTHYGPSYGMIAHGIGADGLRWAKETNDRRLIDKMLAMDADAVVPETYANHNACGGGAVAACIAACQHAGATNAVLLEHTTSAEVLRGLLTRGEADAVGYASIVFGADAK